MLIKSFLEYIFIIADNKLIGIPKNSETWMERQSFGSSKVFFSNLLSKQAIHQSNQAQNLLGVELLYFICIFNLLSD